MEGLSQPDTVVSYESASRETGTTDVSLTCGTDQGVDVVADLDEHTPRDEVSDKTVALDPVDLLQ